MEKFEFLTKMVLRCHVNEEEKEGKLIHLVRVFSPRPQNRARPNESLLVCQRAARKQIRCFPETSRVVARLLQLQSKAKDPRIGTAAATFKSNQIKKRKRGYIKKKKNRSARTTNEGCKASAGLRPRTSNCIVAAYSSGGKTETQETST